MVQKFIEMGSYYNKSPFGLIKTICRATNYESGDSYIVYAQVNKGGNVGEPLLMPEQGFKNIFLV